MRCPDSEIDWRSARAICRQLAVDPPSSRYVRRSGERELSAFKIGVLRVVDGRIAEITTFGVKHFPAFDLPPVLA